MSYMITFKCVYCGLTYKALIRDNKIHFSILDKLHSKSQILNEYGYLVCIECKKINFHIQFTYFQ